MSYHWGDVAHGYPVGKGKHENTKSRQTTRHHKYPDEQ
jgi:hypothetical protein